MHVCIYMHICMYIYVSLSPVPMLTTPEENTSKRTPSIENKFYRVSLSPVPMLTTPRHPFSALGLFCLNIRSLLPLHSVSPVPMLT
jgi:hypothetical protein